MPDFPTGLPDIPAANGAAPLETMHTSDSHSGGMNRAIANILSLATKLGITSSTPTANTVLKGTGAGTSAYGQIVSADIQDGTIQGIDLAPATIDPSKVTFPVGNAGGPAIKLNYTHSADIVGTAQTAAQWNTVVSAQTFTVDAASSLISVSIQAQLLVGAGLASENTGRLLLDGVTAVPLGGGYHESSTGSYVNPVSGGSTVWLGALSAGTHTLEFQVYSTAASNTVYLRALSYPNQEWFRMQVVEHKLGGLAWTPRGVWNSGVIYGANDVVNYNGSSYVSIQTGTNQPPASSPTYWVLLASMGSSLLWRGAWNSGTTYAVNDAVSQGGASYLCILASTNHNPTTDGGVHWAVLAAPGSMTNPMTTTDDLILGGTAGAPIRVPKGPNATVWGVDPSGTLYYRKVVNDDIAPQTIIGGSGGAGSRIAPATIYGSIDLQDGSISTPKYGDTSVTTAKLGAKAVGLVPASGFDGAGATYASTGSTVYAGVVVSPVGMIVGRSKVVVQFQLGLIPTTLNAIVQIGIGVDNTTSPAWYTQSTNPVAGGGMFMAVTGVHIPTADAHNYYATWYANAGTIARHGIAWIHAWVINE